MLLICRNNPRTHAMLRQVAQEDGEFGLIINKFFNKIFIVKCSGNPNLVICDDPFAMLYAFFFHNRRSVHLRLWVLEIWEHQIYINGIKSLIRHLIFTIVSYFCFKISDSLVFPSKARKDFICKKYPRSGFEEKSDIVLNIPEFYQAIPFDDININRRLLKFRTTYKKILIYAGSLQEGRLLEDLLSSKQRYKGIGLIICGDGPLKSQVLSSQNTDKSILFLGSLDRSTLSYVYEKCDFGILSYDNQLLNTRLCAPLKIWEYLHHNLIILGNNNQALKGEWSEYVDSFYENESDIFTIIEQGIDRSPGKRIPVFDKRRVINI